MTFVINRKQMQTKVKYFGGLFFFSIPLIAEVVRKYAFPSNAILAFFDALIFIVVIILIINGKNIASRWILAIIALLFCWSLFTVLFGHRNVMLGLVGARSILTPGFFMIGTAEATRRLGLIQTAKLQYRLLTFWLVVIGIIAVLQLILGLGHWLNYLPEELISDESKGVGDYTVEGIGLLGLFRPTSIFLHTGKFGQIAFVISIYRLFYETAIRKLRMRWIVYRLFDMSIILISGQRAAFLGYLFIIIILLIRERKRNAILLLAMALICVFFVLTWLSFHNESDVNIIQFMIIRGMSGLNEFADRFQKTFIRPVGYVINKFGLIGEGAGAFSLGSAPWGGIPLYYVVPVGAAENSWLRIMAEEGVIGLIIQTLCWFGLLFYSFFIAWRYKKANKNLIPNLGILYFCPSVVLSILLFWANTHDVIGNVTVMSLALGLFGPIFSGLLINKNRAYFAERTK